MKMANIYIWINLFWAFSYNIIMLPMASGIFFTLGAELSPLMSSMAMSMSSVIVVLFSHTLRFHTFDKEKL